MEQQKWKRVEYDTWDAAFKGLVPKARQESVRVADYARELFVRACAMSFGKQVPGGQERIHGRNADVIYKCGMYHQLGKALVPPEYQIWQADFKEEEQQLYKKYTSDGRTLVAMLQVRGAKSRSWKKDRFEETPTENIPWLMIRECCEQHMERWDGSGYPGGRKGNQISAPAQIVGLAKELDRLASGVSSENPFEEAMQLLISQSGTLWNPDLIAVLEAAREECRMVYRKYIHYTMTLPKTIPLVERRPDRVMGLSYRPMISAPDDRIVAYEAEPWFAGILGHPGEVERLNDIAPMLKTTGLTANVTIYFLYEAADTILRMQNCRLEGAALLLKIPDDFYTLGSRLKDFNQLYEDQHIDKSKLMLTVSEVFLLQANKATQETVARYLRNGIEIVLDGFHPEPWEPEKLKELGFRYLRLAPDCALQPDTADTIQALRTWGFTILGGGVDSAQMKDWLYRNGVPTVSGPIIGNPAMENETIRNGIMRQRV
jgi:EAL domain-containing protein (putative c-di-GMP-specific phosphodiesterase class I)